MTMPKNNYVGRNQYGVARAQAEASVSRKSDIGSLVGLSGSEPQQVGDKKYASVNPKQGRRGDAQYGGW